jgi:hypothetical protein
MCRLGVVSQETRKGDRSSCPEPARQQTKVILREALSLHGSLAKAAYGPAFRKRALGNRDYTVQAAFVFSVALLGYVDDAALKTAQETRLWRRSRLSAFPSVQA